MPTMTGWPSRTASVRWLPRVEATTNVYAEVDLEMKAKALANCEVEERGSSTPWKEDKGLMEFLRAL